MKKSLQVKKYMIILVVIFTIVGAVFVGVGIFSAVKYNEVKNDWQIIDAEITDFIISTHTSGGKHHRRHTTRSTQVKYIFDAKEYGGVSADYSSDWKKGDTIKIYCNPNKPEQIYGVKTLSRNAMTFTSIGVLVLAVCVAISIKFLKGGHNNKKLLENGKKIQATVISYTYDKTVSFNSKNPMKIFATYTDENGLKHNVKSENIWEEASEDIVGKTITVYVDSENALNYYVDARSLFSTEN